MIARHKSDFSVVGARRYPKVLGREELDRIATLFGAADRPGKRLNCDHLTAILDLLISDGPIGSVAAELFSSDAQPVRALLLDKSPAANWALGWHQDRTIAVRKRIDVPGFGQWTVKSGQLHVEPPHDVTARMLTLRVHLDHVDDTNGPLKVLPGSQQMGRLTNAEIDQLAAQLQPLVCFAERGDIWAYSTAIVHASDRQIGAKRRRVLQVDYSPDQLPGGLQWTTPVVEVGASA